MNVLIIDDEPLARDRMLALVSRHGDIRVVETISEGRRALQAIRDLRPDIVFLDIEMPAASGLEVASAVTDCACGVIFVTAFDNHAVEAFRLEAIDYLLKPVEIDRLELSLGKARRWLSAKPSPTSPNSPASTDGLWVPGRDAMLKVPFGAIIWVEAARDYVLVHTASRSHILRSTMRAIEDRLPASAFVRISRSAIVNRDFIRDVHFGPQGPEVVNLDEMGPMRVGQSYRRNIQVHPIANGVGPSEPRLP